MNDPFLMKFMWDMYSNIVLYILYSTVGVLKHFLAIESKH